MTVFTPTARALVELMAEAPRGPKRDGLFALWLAVRVIEDLPPASASPDRAFRRRVTQLEKRLSSLALPQPLRRALTTTISRLKDANRSEVGQLLLLLAGASREGIGPEPGEVLQRAGRAQR